MFLMTGRENRNKGQGGCKTRQDNDTVISLSSLLPYRDTTLTEQCFIGWTDGRDKQERKV